MPEREMINIDEELCDGCGECVPACQEGAIQVIEGKARLISEVYCDGLGACLGYCPTGALTIERVEAPDFDQKAVDRHLARLEGRPASLPMTSHQQAPAEAAACGTAAGASGGCPSSRVMTFDKAETADDTATGPVRSELRQWPVQLHLVPTQAPYFQQADLLLASDCSAFAMGDFHRTWLKGRALAIACPKLDGQQEIYLDKLVDLIDGAQISALTVLVMEVPCCSGLLQLARTAVAKASREVPIRCVVAGLQGDIMLDRQVEQ